MKVVKHINDKQQQKTVMFYNRDLINALTEEEAAAENTNPSVVIEKCVLAQLMPKDEDLKNYLAYVYTGEMTKQQALINMCSRLASYGEEGKRSIENRSLVLLLKTSVDGKVPNLDSNPQFFGKYDHTYLNSSVNSIISYIRENYKEDSNASTLCDMWENQFETITPSSPHWYRILFDLLLSNWEIIYNLTSTYKVLMEICKTNTEDTFDKMSLYELRSVLSTIEKTWK